MYTGPKDWTHAKVTVPNTSFLVLAADTGKDNSSVMIQNTGDQEVSLNLAGGPAVLNEGYILSGMKETAAKQDRCTLIMTKENGLLTHAAIYGIVTSATEDVLVSVGR